MHTTFLPSLFLERIIVPKFESFRNIRKGKIYLGGYARKIVCRRKVKFT